MWLPTRSRFSFMDASPVGGLCHPVLAFAYIHLPWAYLVERRHNPEQWKSWWIIYADMWSTLGNVIQTESWILRDLTFIFARSAKRGHRRREPQLRDLMVAADIPVPMASPRSSLSRAGSAGSHLLGKPMGPTHQQLIQRLSLCKGFLMFTRAIVVISKSAFFFPIVSLQTFF